MVNELNISPEQINQYLSVPYVDCGRSIEGWDCWGLVRYVLMAHVGIPDVGNYDHVRPDDKRSLTKSFLKEKKRFYECAPCAGSVVAGFKAGMVVHVGIVIVDGGALKVLHTSRVAGSSKVTLRRFEVLFPRVKYYAHNSHIS